MSCMTASSVCRDGPTESFGVPKRCWCGRKVDLLVSKTNDNPFRRFYRCEGALQAESHLFKWVEIAMEEQFAEANLNFEKSFSELGRMAGEMVGSGRSLKLEIVKQVSRLRELENSVRMREAEACKKRQRGCVVLTPQLVVVVCVAGGLALLFKAFGA
ncbi:hypothetical protein Bca52824_066545 [Brassica carinata]|uniref:GRF-type domain-containing protein n=1 Tax=Brassica carinata TaxID=52824 RepID=A0A8X7QP97_BRACI|nr:hypothetical protein Bca52824_066545 [Brassica carinata]